MSQLRIALETPITRFNGVREESQYRHTQSASALFYLIMYERKNGKVGPVHTRILQHLRNMIVGGREPCMDCNHYWAYPIIASSIALAKATPSVWEELLEDEIERLDILMEAFTIISNFIANDANKYFTGLALRGDVYKGWNPNYRISLVTPIVMASTYFGGADAVDKLLVEFDYDDFISRLETFGFKNMLDVWTTPDFEHVDEIRPGAKKLLTEGGIAYIRHDSNVFEGGRGVGAKVPFLYNGNRADDVAIVNTLIDYCYSGGPVFSHTEDNGDGTYDAYILDGSESPVEGVEGMMLEFNGNDRQGLRSDAWFCELDFSMLVSVVITLRELGIWNEANFSETYGKMYVGNTDLIYKLEHGYVSHSLGQQHTVFEDNIIGYPMMKELWETYLSKVLYS